MQADITIFSEKMQGGQCGEVGVLEQGHLLGLKQYMETDIHLDTSNT